MKLIARSLSSMMLVAALFRHASAQPTGPNGTDSTALPQGSSLLHAVTLLAVLACALVAFRFYTAIRGGRIGRGWMWVFAGFVVFACAQLLLLGGHFGFMPVQVIWVDTFRAVSLLLFFIGINQLRKIVA